MNGTRSSARWASLAMLPSATAWNARSLRSAISNRLASARTCTTDFASNWSAWRSTLTCLRASFPLTAAPKDQLMAQLKTDDLGWHLSFTGEQLDGFYAELSETK